MTEEKTNTTPEIIKTEKSPSMFKPKVLLIGLPIFIVQLVAVYFITANILLSGHTKSASQTEDGKTENTTEQSQEENSGKEGEHNTNTAALIYSLDDLIVNPANTNGKMLLLASVGLSVESEESKKTLEEKQVVVKDAVISVLSSKSVTQLGSATYRDTLKVEILKNLSVQLPGSKVNNIYFSKFIIQ
jgi:flagellar FliL protein